MIHGVTVVVVVGGCRLCAALLPLFGFFFLSFHVKNPSANGLNLHGRDVAAVNDFPV